MWEIQECKKNPRIFEERLKLKFLVDFGDPRTIPHTLAGVEDRLKVFDGFVGHTLAFPEPVSILDQTMTNQQSPMTGPQEVFDAFRLAIAEGDYDRVLDAERDRFGLGVSIGFDPSTNIAEHAVETWRELA